MIIMICFMKKYANFQYPMLNLCCEAGNFFFIRIKAIIPFRMLYNPYEARYIQLQLRTTRIPVRIY